MPIDRLKLCLLQSDSPSPENGSDVFHRLSAIAEAAGHDVTQATVSDNGIALRTPAGQVPTGIAQLLPPQLSGPAAATPAYFVLEWLCREQFDIVFAPAANGLPFYALSAREQGLDLQRTAFCVLGDGLTLLSRHRAGEMPLSLDDVVRDEMERRTLVLADLVLFSEAAAAAWVEQRGWRVPGQCLGPTASGSETAARALWSACLELTQDRRAVSNAMAPAGALPLVSACIPHFNRPDLLVQAIDSLRRQSYERLEIVVVDDASTAPDAIAALDAIESDLVGKGGKLVRHDSNRYPGGARNTAVRHASGDYVLFLDDDDYAKPEQVATLVQAARATGADIVNSFCDRLNGMQPPQPGHAADERWLTIGNAPAAGMFENVFGSVSVLFRKTSFQQIGGFTEFHGVGWEDWEIFARASLAGLNLQTVPRALYWYRRTPGSLVHTASTYAGADRVLTVYAAQMPQSLWPALRLAHGMQAELQRLRLLSVQNEGSQRHQEAVLSHRDALIAHREAELAELKQRTQQHESEFAALSGEVLDLRAACQILLGGYPTPQSAVQAVLHSASWRIGRLPRAMLRRLTGRRPETLPTVSGWAQAAAVVATVQRSTWWGLTGPLRALGRWAGRR